MKVVLFYDKEPQSTLCKWFTGSRAYHVGFTDGVWLWDMSWMRRRRLWSDKKAGSVVMVDCPVDVSFGFLDTKLFTDDNHYGFLDYASFLFRRIATRLRFNGKGLICSEMVANDLKENGWLPPAWFPIVPSPADIELALGAFTQGN
jgi:hypothetical protein